MKFDDVKKLHQKKYRAQFAHYLVEGEHLILELHKAYKNHPSLKLDKNLDKKPDNKPNAKAITLYITEQHLAWAEALGADFQHQVISEKQMRQLSDTKSPQGMVACVPLPPPLTHPLTSTGTKSKGERCIYLHEVQDPGNLGTIIRNLAWFGNFRLLLSPNSVDPFNSKVVRASMGAIFHLPIELDVALDALAHRFKRFAYLDLEGSPVNSPQFANYDCYLFGNEARGIPKETLSAFDSHAFTINGSGAIDSLNLANAVGICAYQLSL
uniref:TrmH family RNA methyltransferase n=1 Tax=Ningiella ruwaisensis TaxID=2364274 RepID=UPI00109F1C55|nr:RNA methyltransferase [Ningiella ruwaisensis]